MDVIVELSPSTIDGTAGIIIKNTHIIIIIIIIIMFSGWKRFLLN